MFNLLCNRSSEKYLKMNEEVNSRKSDGSYVEKKATINRRSLQVVYMQMSWWGAYMKREKQAKRIRRLCWWVGGGGGGCGGVLL